MSKSYCLINFYLKNSHKLPLKMANVTVTVEDIAGVPESEAMTRNVYTDTAVWFRTVPVASVMSPVSWLISKLAVPNRKL